MATNCEELLGKPQGDAHIHGVSGSPRLLKTDLTLRCRWSQFCFEPGAEPALKSVSHVPTGTLSSH